LNIFVAACHAEDNIRWDGNGQLVGGAVEAAPAGTVITPSDAFALFASGVASVPTNMLHKVASASPLPLTLTACTSNTGVYPYYSPPPPSPPPPPPSPPPQPSPPPSPPLPKPPSPPSPPAIMTITTKCGYNSGSGANTQGTVDGSGTVARFARPYAIALTSSGTTGFVSQGNIIRKLTASGTTVAPFAGYSGGGYFDATGTNANFMSVLGLALDPTGTNLYVAEGAVTGFTAGCRIRKIVVATGVRTDRNLCAGSQESDARMHGSDVCMLPRMCA
jgi:hypothetical protein